MDGRRYDSMDGGARATQDAVAENNAGAIVDGYDCMDAGGRATHGAVAEGGVIYNIPSAPLPEGEGTKYEP